MAKKSNGNKTNKYSKVVVYKKEEDNDPIESCSSSDEESINKKILDSTIRYSNNMNRLNKRRNYNINLNIHNLKNGNITKGKLRTCSVCKSSSHTKRNCILKFTGPLLLKKN